MLCFAIVLLQFFLLQTIAYVLPNWLTLIFACLLPILRENAQFWPVKVSNSLTCFISFAWKKKGGFKILIVQKWESP